LFKKSNLKKVQNGWCCCLKNCRMRYLSYCFTDFDKICCHDAHYPLQLQFQVSAFIDGWHHRKYPFPSILYPKTAIKAQITVFVKNAWNIQTFTISLLLFNQFWWNFTCQGIFAFPSGWVTKSLRILKSKLVDGGQLENWEKFQFPSNLYPKTAKNVQITAFMLN